MPIDGVQHRYDQLDSKITIKRRGIVLQGPGDTREQFFTGSQGRSFFFIATGIFLFVFAAISLRWMHETAAALLGAVAVWLVHYIGGTFFPALRIRTSESEYCAVSHG